MRLIKRESALNNTAKLRADALAIWQAGVEAVKPESLIRAKLGFHQGCLATEDAVFELSQFDRIVVVGAGKASAAMARELYQQILAPAQRSFPKLQVLGWINAPQGTCHDAPPGIELYEARPTGVNSPTQEAIHGTNEILKLLKSCGPRDLVLCLISGGGSALLVSPVAPLTLEDKQSVAKHVARAGGNIEQLNAVRSVLSNVKGGGLARACRGNTMLTLVLSDVLGDPLNVIASGPTVNQGRPRARQALDVLETLGLEREAELARVMDFLKQSCLAAQEPAAQLSEPSPCRVSHVILGSNSDAVDAAGVKAVELGYRYVMQSARKSEGDVMRVSEHAVQAIEQLVSQPEVDCWISGGEPTVALPADANGKGGRNQQLALQVFQQLLRRHWPQGELWSRGLAFVAGGTDGEDGPTDAAGGIVDRELYEKWARVAMRPDDYLRRADAYHFFEPLGGLLKTGPTGTNVCDLRVAVVGRESSQ